VFAPETFNGVQNVETFKNFLLQNDSQFSEYLNSDLLKATFDTHMMKEGMITFMA
jgi:transcriptional regulator with GAF, ATPase, and Fis domain